MQSSHPFEALKDFSIYDHVHHKKKSYQPQRLKSINSWIIPGIFILSHRTGGQKQRLLWGVWGIWGIWWVWGSQARSVKRRLSSSSCLFLVFIIAHLTESQKLPFGLLMYLLVNIMAPPSAMIEAIHYNCVYLEGGWQGWKISVTQKMGDDRASDLWARERGPRIARLTLQMHRMWNWRRRPETSSLDSTHTPQTSCNSKNFDF